MSIYAKALKSAERILNVNNLTRCEMETTIVMNAEEKTAEIFTADSVYLRRLGKLHEQFPTVYVLRKKTDAGEFYTMPKRYIRFGKPASEAQREHGRALANMAKEAEA